MSIFQGDSNESNKTSSRVLKPPGGSSIFGNEQPQTPRTVKNHMQSHIFSNEKNAAKQNVRQGAHRFWFIGDQPRRGQKNVDSYSRLFGEPQQAMTPAKNHMKSSIMFDSENGKSSETYVNGNGQCRSASSNGKSGSVSSTSSSVSSSIENLKMNGNGLSKTDGNPVTGEGYKSQHVINKNRIPPGGFSSGLW